jgi:hypothetical protein
MTAMTKPQSTFKLEAVHPDPSRAQDVLCAAIKIVGASISCFSGRPRRRSTTIIHTRITDVHPHSIEDRPRMPECDQIDP